MPEPGRYFRVVVNGRHELGMWPADRMTPPGWQPTPFAGSQPGCRSYVRHLASPPKVHAHPSKEVLNQLVDRIARRLPDAVAITDSRTTVTYAELARRRGAAAARLARIGVDVATSVCLRLPYGVDFLVTVLGVLHLGASCLLAGEVPASPAVESALPINAPSATMNPAKGRWPPGVLMPTRPDRLPPASVVVYPTTAGDEGVGVVWGQDALAALVDLPALGSHGRLAYGGEETPPLILAHAIRGLSVGAELLVPGPDESFSIGARFIPGMTTLAAGDSARAYTRLYLAGKGHVRPIEVFGYPETGMLNGADATLDGPGRPLPGTHFYVLNQDLYVVAPGGVGRLYLGGNAIATGYAARPDLTLDRFLPDPFIGDGKRMFATGVRVRREADGSLTYHR